MNDLIILFENGDLIAVDKPPGLLSHASVDKKRPDAFRQLKLQLEKREGQTPSLSLLHRLDRDTSGVLLFSKNPVRHDEWSALFRQRAVEKVYIGLCRGRPPADHWEIENHLAEEKTSASRAPRTIPVRSGGLKATTHFRILRQTETLFLVEAQPQSGRRHQIRSHLMTSGCPLWGDLLYGGSGDGRVRLHAWRLSWPDQGKVISAEAPIPTDFSLRPLGDQIGT